MIKYIQMNLILPFLLIINILFINILVLYQIFPQFFIYFIKKFFKILFYDLNYYIMEFIYF